MKPKHILIYVAALALACGPVLPDPPDPSKYVKGAQCDTACSHWQQLGCDFAEPTPAGVECVEVCEMSIPDAWNLECMAAIESCEQVDSCP